MHSALYFDSPPLKPIGWSWKLLSPLYAEIVLDLQARDLKDRLFTYRVPEFLAEDVFVGAQVLVPFGHQDSVGGYVVSLLSEPRGDFNLKDIAEVIEPDPLFDKDYIDFLAWLAFKSCAQLSDVIQAAIPASLAPRIKRTVIINKTIGSAELAKMKSVLSNKDQACAALLGILFDAKGGGLSLKTLQQRFARASKMTRSQFNRALAFLRQEGVVKIVAESDDKVAPKQITRVIRCHGEPKTARQREIVALLEKNKGTMPLSDFLKGARTTYNTIHKLRQESVLDLIECEVIRDPMKTFSTDDQARLQRANKPVLTPHQQSVLETLSTQLKRILSSESHDHEQNVAATSLQEAISFAPEGPDPFSPWLLHGVTGSGKTEVYLQLIEEALKHDRTALLMVPEISLTPQLASRLQARFGARVSIWHSAISPGERYDTWRRLRSGDVSVLLGARSAVLANIPNLGIIILDEEHDSSYKQSSPSPRYNAKEVAIEKARRHKAMVLFGSATPDLVAYSQAKIRGRILELPERVHMQPMPEVRIVDMRNELNQGNRSILSMPLQKSLGERLEANEQTILLINRRGYASHVFCRACGQVMLCRNCSVSLVYHRSSSSARPSPMVKSASAQPGYLSCHHCNYERSVPKTCPSCSSPFIKEYGLGTQQVEETVARMFPSARLLRLDSDIAARKGAYREIFEQFSQGEADILIGTQMVAKGLDIANVTLVGVLVADAALNMPDYRATERGFQLLSQVSGRAGRGDKPGQVILQTYNPELDVIKWAKNHDFQSFYEAELLAREAFSYPPYSRIVRLVMQGSDACAVELELERLAEEISVYLEDKTAEKSVQILGPAPCIIEKVKNKFRFHLLIKVKGIKQCAPLIESGVNGVENETIASMLTDPLDHLLHFLRNKKTPKQLSLAVDVDALDLL